MAPIWYPESYCQRDYVAFRCQPPYDGPPHYPDAPAIVIADITKLDVLRMRFWRRAREAAITQWAGCGLTLMVREPRIGYRPGRITLAVTLTQDGTAGQADFGATVPDASGSQSPLPGVGWAHINAAWFEAQYKATTWGAVRKVIAHELGHCFGFAHGGTGIMTSPITAPVNQEECQAVMTYFA